MWPRRGLPSPVAMTGLGALATVVGRVALGPVVARPAAAVLGAGLGFAAARVRRRGGGRGSAVSWTLARRNAMRNRGGPPARRPR